MAFKPSFMKRVNLAFNALMGSSSLGISKMEEELDSGKSFASNWLSSELELGKGRLQKYREYEEMQEASKLALKAIKAHADTTVSGGRGKERDIQLQVEGNAKAEEIANETFNRLGLNDNIWRYAFDMIAYGDKFFENVLSEDGKRVVRLKPLDRNTMFVVVDSKGRLGGDNKGAYKQEHPQLKDPVYFDYWQVTHFHAGATRANGLFLDSSEPYGVNMALPFGARRTFKQFQMICDSIIMQRLSRASMKVAYFYDTGEYGFTAAMEYIDKKKEEMRKNRIVDSSGNIKSEYNPFLQDEDIILPKSEKLKNTDVKILQGDSNIGNIDDVKFVRDLYISDLETPKPLLGFEEDTRTRATLSGMDIQFARTVRRWQKAANVALKMPLYLDLFLQGVDPSDVQIELIFPAIGTIDELTILKADQLRVEIAKVLALEIGLDLSWIMKRFFNLSENEIEELMNSSIGPIGNNNNSNENLNLDRIVSAVLKDDRLGAVLEDSLEFVNWRRGIND